MNTFIRTLLQPVKYITLTTFVAAAFDIPARRQSTQPLLRFQHEQNIYGAINCVELHFSM